MLLRAWTGCAGAVTRTSEVSTGTTSTVMAPAVTRTDASWLVMAPASTTICVMATTSGSAITQ